MQTFKKFLTILLSLILLCSFVTVQGSEKATIEVSQSINHHYESDEPEYLYNLWLENLFYGTDVSYYGISAGNRLNGLPKKLYEYLKNEIINLKFDTAFDSKVSTCFVLSSDVLKSFGAETSYTASNANEAFAMFKSQFDTENVIDALLHDCPYELYWYDKVLGMKYSASVMFDGAVYTITSLTFKMAVNESFRPADYDENSPSLSKLYITPAVNAYNKAHEIVSQYKPRSDYDKLVAYKNEILALTSYDYSAANAGNFTLNSSPWQLISVFDGDDDTKSVCEGYSKAFQYLCDLSEFVCNVNCYTVIGSIPAGGHMWNIVEIKGKHYLTDITNSESGTIGASGELFLAGATGGIAEGFSVKGYPYFYDSDTTELWGSDNTSILNIASESFVWDGENHSPLNGSCTVCGADSKRIGKNLSYKIENGILYIIGSGEMYDFNDTDIPWYDHRDEITEVILPQGLENISKNAFRGLLNLSSIEIPESVKVISDAAFWGCSSLEQITLPENIESIGSFAFYNAKNLTSIYFLGNAPAISSNSFMEVKATAYYLENKEWDNSNKQNYEGEINWQSISSCDLYGHSEAINKGYAATCTENGLTDGRYCLDCGEIIVKQESVNKLGHDLGEFYTTAEPDCTKNGEMRKDCSRCDYFETKTLSFLGHKGIILNAVPATCTEPGLTEGVYCERCGETLTEQETIGPKGHNYSSEVILPDCLNKGYTIHVCSACGDTYKDSYKDAKGHSYTSTITPPTCTDKGYTTYVCTSCGDTYKDNFINAKGHSETVVKGYPATCTDKGMTDGKMCSVCGIVTVKQTEIAAKGHEYRGIVTAPTCTKQGYTTFTCIACGDNYKTNYTNATNKHVYSNNSDASCNTCGFVRVVSVPMYRMYDVNGGEHFYTGSTEERDFLIAAGWQYEGVGFNFPLRGSPVHRLYEPKTGEHLYTMDTEEMNKLLSEGWNYEGVAFNSAESSEIPQYRLHNPNATRGAYHFTGSIEERDLLISFGWEYQGIGFYSCLR